MATEILMTAHKALGPEMRRKYPIDVIRVFPDNAIDWVTVDWVQAAPIKTRPLCGPSDGIESLTSDEAKSDPEAIGTVVRQVW